MRTKLFGVEGELKHTKQGVQFLYKLNNKYTISVIKSLYSYGGSEGLWELALIKDGYVISESVKGWLNNEQVERYIKSFIKKFEVER